MSFITGEIGVCWLTFDGDSLGKTVDSVNVSCEKTEKEIMASQNGMKAEDYADTGIQWIVTAKVKNLTNAILAKVMPGIGLSGAGTAMKSDNSSLFKSHRDNYAKELVVTLHDSDTNAASTDPEDSFTIPIASPLVTKFKEYGPDVQNTLDVSFRSLAHPTTGVHVYSGAAASLNIT